MAEPVRRKARIAGLILAGTLLEGAALFGLGAATVSPGKRAVMVEKTVDASETTRSHRSYLFEGFVGPGESRISPRCGKGRQFDASLAKVYPGKTVGPGLNCIGGPGSCISDE